MCDINNKYAESVSLVFHWKSVVEDTGLFRVFVSGPTSARLSVYPVLYQSHGMRFPSCNRCFRLISKLGKLIVEVYPPDQNNIKITQNPTSDYIMSLIEEAYKESFLMTL